ncbi:hypothetical protein BHM03_00058619 [Ensete ventricosum]|nr:hypothetical protein BHM03_00058619 [Ensete ventricosum]
MYRSDRVSVCGLPHTGRCRLVFPRVDEGAASSSRAGRRVRPHSPGRRRGVASFSGLGMRRRLVFPRGDETTSCSPAGRRGAA